jgi:hypothetical protein
MAYDAVIVSSRVVQVFLKDILIIENILKAHFRLVYIMIIIKVSENSFVFFSIGFPITIDSHIYLFKSNPH